MLTALNRLSIQCRPLSLRCLSSLKQDPATLVSGLTRERAESDPALLEYLQFNYPELFEDASSSSSSQIPIETDKIEVDEPVISVANDYPLNIRPLTCYLRDPVAETGTRRGDEMRQAGLIPGILHGGNPDLGISSRDPASKTLVKTPWRFLQGELDRYHYGFEARVYDLTILEDEHATEGHVHRVVPHSVQRHPVKETLFCVNYCRYHAGRPLRLPVVYTNKEESPALKRDGYIIRIQRTIECLVEDGVLIPPQLEVECSGLQLKQVIRKDRLLLPDGVRLSDKVLKRGDDFIIGVVQGRARDAGDDS